MLLIKLAFIKRLAASPMENKASGLVVGKSHSWDAALGSGRASFKRASGRQLVTSSGARVLLSYWGDTHKPIRGTVAGK